MGPRNGFGQRPRFSQENAQAAWLLQCDPEEELEEEWKKSGSVVAWLEITAKRHTEPLRTDLFWEAQ